MVELVACLDGCVVDFGCYAAGVGECVDGGCCEVELFADGGDFVWCFFAGFAFSAAHSNAMLFWRYCLFEDACDYGCYA